jgi:hypothetical protein
MKRLRSDVTVAASTNKAAAVTRITSSLASGSTRA